MSSPFIIAHRGGKDTWPENSPSAFQGCEELGIDAIELDVQATPNGLIVQHPQNHFAGTTCPQNYRMAGMECEQRRMYPAYGSKIQDCFLWY